MSATRQTRRQGSSFVFKKAISWTRLILVAAMLSHDSCVDLLLHIAGQLLEQHLELVETSLNQRPIEVVAGKPVRASRFKLTESRHSFDGAAELSSLGVNLRNCASDWQFAFSALKTLI